MSEEQDTIDVKDLMHQISESLSKIIIAKPDDEIVPHLVVVLPTKEGGCDTKIMPIPPTMNRREVVVPLLKRCIDAGALCVIHCGEVWAKATAPTDPDFAAVSAALGRAERGQVKDMPGRVEALMLHAVTPDCELFLTREIAADRKSVKDEKIFFNDGREHRVEGGMIIFPDKVVQ